MHKSPIASDFLFEDQNLPLDDQDLSSIRRWQKIVTVDSTAKILRQYPTPESPDILASIRNSGLSNLDKAYQWSATKAHFDPIVEALNKLTQLYKAIVILALIVIFLLGCLGSWGLLVSNAQERVNIFWWLLAFLGWPIFLLGLWAILFSFPIKASTPVTSVLEYLIKFAQKKARNWTGLSPLQEQVAASIYAFYQQSIISRWLSASLLHAAWALYLIGGTLVLVLKLSFEHYVFVWQTSLIPTQTFSALIQAIGFIPDLLGFTVPNSSLIEASQWTGSGGSDIATTSWASFMIGCAITYGILPRAIFWLGSHLTLRHRLRTVKLYPNNPYYGNYLRLLIPNIESSVGGMVITNDHSANIVIRQPLGNADAKIHWLRYESMINQPFSLRQAYENSILLIDIDDLDSHHKAVREISLLTPEDAYAICIAVNIFQVPDEGFKQFVQRLLAISQVRIILLLTGGDLMKKHGEKEDITPRIESWRQTALAAQLHSDDCILMNGISPLDAQAAISAYLQSATTG